MNRRRAECAGDNDPVRSPTSSALQQPLTLTAAEADRICDVVSDAVKKVQTV